MEEVKKASGFKNYNDVFWFNETKTYGVRYQCKECGKITVGMADADEMHKKDCEHAPPIPEESKMGGIPWKTEQYKARLKVGKFSLVVHRYLGCGEQYFATCHHGPFEKAPLESLDLEDAKKEALEMFVKTLREAANDLGMRIS